MKKFVLYGFIILLVFNLLSRLWTSITLDEDEEVSMFIQKVEMLESSDDYYHVSNTSNEYLNFLEENIEWFSSEQSKELSKILNSLRSLAISKIDSIDQSRAEIKMKEEEEKRKKKEEVLSPEVIQKKKIEDQFHPWDGSHIKLERYIKKELMNDPDSYDHIESGYTIEDGKLYVMVTFRGNNAFGGKVKNKVLAICDKENGDVIEIVEVFTD